MKTVFWVALLCWLAPAQAQTLNLFIWADYIDPVIVKQFEQQTGIKLSIALYESNEQLLTKLKTGGTSQYDLVVPSDFLVPTLIKEKLIQPLDHSKIPNLKNLDTRFQNPPFDPGNRYTAAYQWGMVGLMYRKDKVAAVPHSWSALFENPSGSFALLDSNREMLGMALQYLGYSVNTPNHQHIQAAQKLLQQALKSSYSAGIKDYFSAKVALLKGDLVYSVNYSGAAVKGALEDPNIAFVVPREGGILFVDSLVITANAPHVEAAHRFINFILEAKVGAQLSGFNQFPTPNKASLPLISPKDRRNPALYPSAEVAKKLEFILDLGERNGLYEQAWRAVRR
jgi:spermidine/putrescine transport system substrate-binding protein